MMDDLPVILIHLIPKDENYEAIKKRILDVDILIIDEISIMSQVMFEKLETVLRIKKMRKMLLKVKLFVNRVFNKNIQEEEQGFGLMCK